MTTFANSLALLALMVIPAGILYWLLIHGGLPIWRRLGVRATWAIVLPCCAGLAATAWLWRRELLADGPHFHPLTCILGLAVYALNFWLWRLGKEILDPRTMIGLPELEDASPTRPLLDEGLYGIIRHPRYVSAWLFLLSLALMLGHRVLWALFAVGIVGFATVVWLEERELHQRYGPAYAAYARRVPRFLPHILIRPRSVEVKKT